MDLLHVDHMKFYQNGFLIKYFVHQLKQTQLLVKQRLHKLD